MIRLKSYNVSKETVRFFTRKIRRFEASWCVVLLLVSGWMLWQASKNLLESRVPAAAKPGFCLVIDPGHGGIDGGAIGLDGSKESDINLEIARKLQAMASFLGQQTQMTRSDDSRRTDLLSYSEHEDLAFRTNFINTVPQAVLFSIHQNCFPTSQPSGAQVLYAKGTESKQLGLLIQTNLKNQLQPDNRRLAEPADPDLYITAHVHCPAVLVECGFLSNPSDLEKLKDDRYQSKLSMVLLASFLQFTYEEVRL